MNLPKRSINSNDSELSKNYYQNKDNRPKIEEIFSEREIANIKGGKNDLENKSGKLNAVEPTPTNDQLANRIALRQSLFNRWCIFANNSLDFKRIESGLRLDDVESVKSFSDSDENLYNPTTEKICNFFSWSKEGNRDIGAIIYEWNDFLWTKLDGIVPNNRMITLRRFPMPVTDNIKDLTKRKDIARAITWYGEGTNNTINDILGMNWGFRWDKLTSEIQVAQSQKFGYGGGLGVMKLPFGIAENYISQAKAVETTGDTSAANIQRRRAAGYTTQIDGPYRDHDSMKGPINVIDEINVPKRGLDFSNDIKLVFEWELKSYGKIQAKDALLDIIANLLILTYSNAPFWGGKILQGNDPRAATIIGDQKYLESGEWVKYFKSVGLELGSMAQNLFKNGIGGALSGIGNALADKFMNNQLGNADMPPLNELKALLTGEPRGEWHITIGNPFRPIAVIGNLQLKNCKIEFSEELGPDDFPTSLKAEIQLQHAMPRDAASVSSMFNGGYGRLYYKSKQFDVYFKSLKEQPNSITGQPKEKRAPFERWNTNTNDAVQLSKNALDYGARLLTKIKENSDSIIAGSRSVAYHPAADNRGTKN
jgi:hypothetical protein